MMILFEMCTESNFLTCFLFLKYVFNILCIILPLIMIYRGISSCFKCVVSGDSINKEFTGLFKSLISALIVFLIPSFCNFVFVDLLYDNSGGFSKCFTNATVDRIKQFREAEVNGRKEELIQRLEDIDRANSKRLSKEKEKADAIKVEREEQEILEQQQQQQQQQGNNGSGGGSPNSGTNTLQTGVKNIIIGDSRTVGMCASITGDWTNCQFSNHGPYINGNDIYIAQGSMGYTWFNSSAVPAVNKILAENSNTTFNIYSLMGVNFLLSDIDKYIPKYRELANGSWSKHNLILVSVNPVNEVIEAQHGYSTKNSSIITFNNKLKTGTSGISNVKYCDTYNKIINNMQTGDGLHYNGSTYKDIYNNMKSCAS